MVAQEGFTHVPTPVSLAMLDAEHRSPNPQSSALCTGHAVSHSNVIWACNSTCALKETDEA